MKLPFDAHMEKTFQHNCFSITYSSNESNKVGTSVANLHIFCIRFNKDLITPKSSSLFSQNNTHCSFCYVLNVARLESKNCVIFCCKY